jgi:hypothetical protein
MRVGSNPSLSARSCNLFKFRELRFFLSRLLSELRE